MKDVVLIKYGEIALKGRNRHIFEKALKKNISHALGIDSGKIQNPMGRMYIQVDEAGSDRIKQKLSRVFGVHASVNALRCEFDFNSLKSAAEALTKSVTEKNPKTFKIHARRTAKQFPFDSMQINADLGEYILERFPNLTVDVHNPDLVIFVEVRLEGIFVYANTDSVLGPGGLPVGVSARGLLLLSGGIDSPVAGWMMLKRGVSLDAVYFDSFPYTGEKAKEKTIALAQKLMRYRPGSVRLYIPRFTDIQLAINKHVREPLWTLLHRRFMFLIAQQIAEKNDYRCLVTGENLGQVASQTVENINAIAQHVRLPIFRPLIGFDKSEIIERAQGIHTYDISILPYEDCCTVFASKHPRTKGNVEEVDSALTLVNSEELIKNSLDRMEIFSVTEKEVKQIAL